jgi:Tfp pilus assembly protein PilF
MRNRFGFSCRGAALCFLVATVCWLTGCDSGRDGLPRADSPEHRAAVAAFQVGIAAFQVGDDARADKNLGALTQLAPGEAAGWASWAALALRQGKLDVAEQRLDRAIALAPKQPELHYLRGLLRSLQGRSDDALAAFAKASELDPNDARAAYALAQQLERQGGADADARAQQIVQQLLARQPDSPALLVEVARLAAKRGDAAVLRGAVEKIATLAAAWPSEVQEQTAALQDAVKGADWRAAAIRTTRLRNVLQRVPEYRDSIDSIKPPAVAETPPLARLLALKAPVFKAAAADTGLRFGAQPISAAAGTAAWVGALQLGSQGPPVIGAVVAGRLVLTNGQALARPGSGGDPARPDSVLQLDFSYDFKTDLALVGAQGLRLYQQGEAGGFSDVTAASKLSKGITGAAYSAAWAADIEADGDLDIVLGHARGEPLVLRNNGDGTFEPVHPFKGIAGVRQFLWADLDGDGTPEATIVDAAGQLHVFMNRRQGQFRERALPAELGAVQALGMAEFGADGRWSLLAVRASGAISRVTDRGETKPWEIADIARVPAELQGGELRVRVADFDNNGAADLLLMRADAGAANAAGAALWLAQGESGVWPAQPLLIQTAAAVHDVADLDGDGRLDLLGLSAQGQAVQLLNKGTFAYHWQVIRPHAAQAFGDQRINPFGVGGEVEIRAGGALQKRPIAGPLVHFGLGEQSATDIIRIHWPNGVVQAEFDAKADQSVATEQRLKGSCPFLFAWDGSRMNFVKDAVPWGSAIGLRINTIGSASIAATEEWYRIGRDQLVARDGHYELRITAELWEVYYYDQFALLTVDHPPGTEVFVDERFTIPAVKPQIVVVDTPQPLAGAHDDTGQDVSALLANDDGRAVDSFGRGQYQGVTRDHFVELDLGNAATAQEQVLLIAHGSLRPTDSSINVALSQGQRWRPQGMSLEVPNGRGGWRIARKDLGFPAGRKKIVLFDLSELFAPGVPKRVRIRSNLEIYWDKIEWAKLRPDVTPRAQTLEPSVADLHYRGYSVLSAPPAGAPEVPDYDTLAGSAPRWRDLVGYYTRYGDVRELLREADDRYVIVNAGDEMSFRFPVPAPPPTGWHRDFVVAGDGWIKDGDYNSSFSRTVQPLPHHGERDYVAPLVRLEDEVVWQRHARDWDDYHTRYVTGRAVLNALRPRGAGPPP